MKESNEDNLSDLKTELGAVVAISQRYYLCNIAAVVPITADTIPLLRC
jgi:hypothetical protein